VLAVADERFDDLQGRARFALGALALEVGGKLAVGAQDFLLTEFLKVGVTCRGGFLSGRVHRAAGPAVKLGRTSYHFRVPRSRRLPE
jgi:hypothetical protein